MSSPAPRGGFWDEVGYPSPDPEPSAATAPALIFSNVIAGPLVQDPHVDDHLYRLRAFIRQESRLRVAT
jgi:hypothetical protein